MGRRERTQTGRGVYMLVGELRRKGASVRPASVRAGRHIIDDNQDAGLELTTEECLQEIGFPHDDVRPPSA